MILCEFLSDWIKIGPSYDIKHLTESKSAARFGLLGQEIELFGHFCADPLLFEGFRVLENEESELDIRLGFCVEISLRIRHFDRLLIAKMLQHLKIYIFCALGVFVGDGSEPKAKFGIRVVDC